MTFCLDGAASLARHDAFGSSVCAPQCGWQWLGYLLLTACGRCACGTDRAGFTSTSSLLYACPFVWVRVLFLSVPLMRFSILRQTLPV